MNKNSSCGNSSYHFKRVLCIISKQRFWQLLLLWDFQAYCNKKKKKWHNGFSDCFCIRPSMTSARRAFTVLLDTVSAVVKEFFKYTVMRCCMFLTCTELKEKHKITTFTAHRPIVTPLSSERRIITKLSDESATGCFETHKWR